MLATVLAYFALLMAGLAVAGIVLVLMDDCIIETTRRIRDY